jgi:hypothetical protein
MIELILIIVVILAVIGFSIFAWTDYDKHKESNVVDFGKVDAGLKEEKETRLSNLKFVVDQVNKTNEDMDTTYGKKFEDVDASINKYKAFESGFGSLITARNRSSNVDIPLTNLATMPATDMNMIKHVSFLGGATIKDLQMAADKPDMRLKVCGTGDKPACIELPNADGDTYLTSLVSGKGIVFDAPVKNYGAFGLYSMASKEVPTMTLQAATAEQANFVMGANGVMSIRTNETTPTELMHINKSNTTIKNTLTLQNSSGKEATLAVNADGDLTIVANRVRVNGVEVPVVVATSEVAVPATAPVVAPAPAPSTPVVAETFCTAAVNQGKNYQCVEGTSELNNKYFKLEGGARREYADWNQAFENSGRTLTAAPLASCSELANCQVGAPIAVV